jgi:hypothetical protein
MTTFAKRTFGTNWRGKRESAGFRKACPTDYGTVRPWGMLGEECTYRCDVCKAEIPESKLIRVQNYAKKF